MTIIPICRRELTVIARRGRLQSERAWFVGILTVIAIGTFLSWYYSSNRFVGRYLMSRVAAQSFVFVVIAHAVSLMSIATIGALSIAGELDRKTLGFLLATRLRNAEIVLGKLAACGSSYFTTLAAGLPVMILLNVLGGISPRLIVLAYAGITSTAFLILALAIWVSSGAPDSRRASSGAVLYTMAWLILPFLVGMTPILTRIGLTPPRFVLAANAWVLASNPLSLLPLFMGGGVTSTAMYHRVAWMITLQLGAAVILLLAAMMRLRRAFRANAGGDGGPLSRRPARPSWRFRPRPPVSDNPILWREMHTSRGGGLIGKLVGYLLVAGMFGALCYVTLFFARRALVEVWKHGYTTVATATSKPELNLVIRFFLQDSGPNVPVDAARVDFNLFLRIITCLTVFLLVLIASGTAVETLASERAKDTWSSLIATPLSGREILREKLLASIWRLRELLITILSLWTLGLICGAVHPLGYLAAILTLASSTAFCLAAGQRAALIVEDHATAVGRGLGWIVLPLSSGLLPFLPRLACSVALGATSPPLVACLALVSYRELNAAWRYADYPLIQWLGLSSGDGPWVVLLTCVIGIIAPTIGAAGSGHIVWQTSTSSSGARPGMNASRQSPE